MLFIASLAVLPLLGSAFISPLSPLSAHRHNAEMIPTAMRGADKNAACLFSQRTTSEELIPREILFGNPENISPLLSPDGKHLAYLAPSPEGVMNVFIRDLSKQTANGEDAKKYDRMITNEPKRAIRSVAWAYDSQTILYMNDNDGDENFHLVCCLNPTFYHIISYHFIAQCLLPFIYFNSLL